MILTSCLCTIMSLLGNQSMGTLYKISCTIWDIYYDYNSSLNTKMSMTSQETSDCNNKERYREELQLLHLAQVTWQSEFQWNNPNISADQEEEI